MMTTLSTGSGPHGIVNIIRAPNGTRLGYLPTIGVKLYITGLKGSQNKKNVAYHIFTYISMHTTRILNTCSIRRLRKNGMELPSEW